MLVVIVNHFNRDILPGGYLGVDMFFVLSGYLITLVLMKDYADPHAPIYTRRNAKDWA